MQLLGPGPLRRSSAHAATWSGSLSSTPRGLPARVHLAQVTQTERDGTLGTDSLVVVVAVVAVVAVVVVVVAVVVVVVVVVVRTMC